MHHRWKKGQSRTCDYIVSFLKEVGEAPFPQIKEYINSRYKHGVTSPRLGNILSKYTEFEKVGMVGNYHNGGYLVSVWRLTDLE